MENTINVESQKQRKTSKFNASREHYKRKWTKEVQSTGRVANEIKMINQRNFKMGK
jgi:hypothetical protein